MTEYPEGRALGADRKAPSTVQVARIYDHLNGGKESREADRDAASEAEIVLPGIRVAARRNRAFLERVGAFLAQKVDQFLDIGTGIPNPPNLTDIVWEVNPDASFLCVDNDEEVIRQAQPFVKAAGGRADFLHANIVDTETILRRAREQLDMSRPIALSVIAVWHFLKDGYTLPGDPQEYQAAEVMCELIAALAPGSFVAISHATSDLDPQRMQRLAGIYRSLGIPAQARSYHDILALFGGLPMVDPGLVRVDEWHPELGPRSTDDGPVPVYAGVGRKS